MLTPRILTTLMTLAIVMPGAPSVRTGVPVHEIEIVAKKFTFEPSTINVVAGEQVRLVIRSADTKHGFAIEKLKIDVDVPKDGTPVTVEFTAPAAGRYQVECSDFCGLGHRHMKAELVSAAPSR
jgi:cytochrome c oxidase subunit 2